jgi:cytochrome c biogenesis protein CcdA
MVGTMIPMVYGKNIASRKPPSLLAIYTVASAAGGCSAGAVLGCMSRYLSPYVGSSLLASGVIAGSVAIVGSLREAGLVSILFPESHWQVPREWAATQPHAAATSLYGFFLGVGLLTRMSNCLYPVLVWILLQRRTACGILVMSLFGVCRAVPLWVIYLTSESRDTEYSRLTIYSLGQWQPAVRLISAFALISVGSFLVASWCHIGYGR